MEWTEGQGTGAERRIINTEPNEVETELTEGPRRHGSAGAALRAVRPPCGRRPGGPDSGEPPQSSPPRETDPRLFRFLR